MASTEPQTADADLGNESTDDARTSPEEEPKTRPTLHKRKSNGKAVSGDMADEPYAENDARTMSPRKSIDEVAQLGDEARRALEEHARTLQASLLEIVDRVENVRAEHAKLEGGNQFLQSYIGELMQTSKITSTGAGGKATKARAVRTTRS